MKVKEKNNVIVFKKGTEEYTDFVAKILEQEHIFKSRNIIVDLEDTDLRPSELVPFEELAEKQRQQKKSLVIIASIDFDEVNDDMMVVPTLQEGFDIIEMEEIERDLGF